MEELDKALEIQTRVYNNLNEIIMQIVKKEETTFPNYSLMVPTLCLAAMCQYINTYIDTFPDDMKPKIISMVYKAIGFAYLDGLNDLANMEVAGHA